MATGTPGTTARQYAQQVVHYLRFRVTYSDAGISSGVGKQTLPAGAVIVGSDIYVATTFNAQTTNVLTVGTNSTNYNNIIASGSQATTAGTLVVGVLPAVAGTATGPLSADAQVFAKYTQTGTAATQGDATIVIKYVVANDL